MLRPYPCVLLACCILHAGEPSAVGWNAAAFPWKAPVADEAVAIDGPVAIRWLPRPFAFTAGASVRYIDHEAGDDAHPGTSRERPWRHHPWDAAATGRAAAERGVHTYVFKRGVVYRGALVGRDSGTAAEPVRLTSDPAWGLGDAEISGAHRVAGPWRRVDGAELTRVGFPAVSGGKLWSAELPGGFVPHALWLRRPDGTRLRLILARDPDWTVEDRHQRFSGWHRIAEIGKGMPLTWIFAPKVFTDPDPAAYVGARLWTDHPVASGEFSITGPIPTPIRKYDPARGGVPVPLMVPNRHPAKNSPFYLENLPRFLDRPGEWIFQRDGRRLYVRLPDDADPAAAVIEAARHEVLIDLPAQSHVVISGLTLTGGNSIDPDESHDVGGWKRPVPITRMAAVRLRGSCRDIALSHLRIVDTAGGGVVNEILAEGDSVDGAAVTDSVLERIDNGGIILCRGPLYRFLPLGSLTGVSILRNRMSDIGLRLSGHYGQAVDLGGVGVAEVAGNVIERVAFQGINVWSGKLCGGVQGDAGGDDPLIRVQIHRNQVVDALLHATDFGAIEAWGTGTTYIHGNVIANASGYVAHRDQWHKNVLIYLDGHHKGFTFNNVGWSDSDARAWKGMPGSQFHKMVRGRANIAFHNTSHHLRNHYQKEADRGDLNLIAGNLMIDSLNFLSFWNLDQAEGVGFTGNLAAGAYENIWARWRGEEFRTIEELRADLARFPRLLAADAGWVTDGSPVRDAAGRDYRPAAGSAALGRGTRVFTPWALHGVVGEWHFLRDAAEPGRIHAYDLWPQAFHTEMGVVAAGLPDHRLLGTGFTAADYVPGPLDGWTQGALAFDGTKRLTLADARLREDIPYKTKRGKEQAMFPGAQRKSLRVGAASLLVEAVLRIEPGRRSGSIIAKLDAQAGYALRLAADGHIELLLRHAGRDHVVRSEAPLDDGRWHHVLAEADRPAGLMTMHIDGRTVSRTAAAPPAGATLDNDADVLVGDGFIGALDWLRIGLGTLADARTSIAELMAWQFNGPPLRDLAGRMPAPGRERAIGAIDDPAAGGPFAIRYTPPGAAGATTAATGDAPDPQAQLKTGDGRTVKLEHWGAVSVTRSVRPGAPAEVQIVLGTETVTGQAQHLVVVVHGVVGGARRTVERHAPILVQPFQAGPFAVTSTVPTGLDGVIAEVFISPDGSPERRRLSTEVPIIVAP